MYSDGETTLHISNDLSIPAREIEITAVRAQGVGGQHVNKVASAVHLRFDIRGSSLPHLYKQRLLALHDQRISKLGVVVIKSQQYRSQEKNRAEALRRLRELIATVTKVRKYRRPTAPTRGSQKRRLDAKARRGKLKALRGRVPE